MSLANMNMNNNNKTRTTLTKKENLDSSIQLILEKNFDIDSKICVITLLKIIDNVIQKPNNTKVRTIRTSNKTIQQKIINNYGHHFLIACGFIVVGAETEAMAMSDNDSDERLVLNEIHEDTEFLIYARHTLARIAIYELNIKADTLPSFRPPPPKVTFGVGGSGTSTTNTGFNVYEGKRFDGQAAATGTNLGPPSGWKSKTETELEILQKRELKLEKELSTKNNNNSTSASSAKTATTTTTTTTTVDRQWTVFLPGQQQQQKATSPTTTAAANNNVPYVRGMSLKTPPAVKTTTTTTNNSNNNSNNNSSSASSSDSSKEDKQLLAKHFQNQFAKQKAAQSIGFTTKAMRDLSKIKKSKVYSHTQLAITFPDGIIVKANFSTTEKLSMVMKGITEQVLFSNTDTLTLPQFEFYISPPRTILDPSQSLKKLGLVPAAKIYVSWNSPGLTKIPTSTLGQGWYILPELLLPSNSKNNANANANSSSATGTGSSMTTIMGPVMPISVSVLGGGGNKATGGAAASASLRNDTNPKPTKQVKKKSKAEKEAELMKRMLG